MVHVELVGRLFEIDLRSPQAHARTWFGDQWIEHFLTNEEVMLCDDAHPVTRFGVEALKVFRT
jgi:hypothetical protein